MAWIEVHQSLWDHRKTMEVADALDLPELYAAAHLIALWTWAIDNAPDGELPASERIVARGAKWTGDASQFCHALRNAGFLERHGDSDVIHDWDDYAGRLIAQRRANAERQRRHRDRQKSPEPQGNPPKQSNADVTVTSPSRNGATQQNSTQQNSTQQNSTNREANASHKSESKSNGYPNSFERFWAAYPSGHGVKKTAYEQWRKIKPDDLTTRKIMTGLERWKTCERWREGFVKSAHIWLRERWWENEPPPEKAVAQASGHLNTPKHDEPFDFFAE